MTQVPDTLLATVRAELSTAQLGDVLDTSAAATSSCRRPSSRPCRARGLVGRAMPLLEIAATPDDHSFGLMFEALDSLRARTRCTSPPPAPRPSRSGAS